MLYESVFVFSGQLSPKLAEDKFNETIEQITQAGGKILKKEKWVYYTGKASPEVYVEKPFDYKVLKADLDKYFDADADLIKCTAKIEYYQIMLDYLESILKIISNRTYQIKNAIEWQRFTNGL